MSTWIKYIGTKTAVLCENKWQFKKTGEILSSLGVEFCDIETKYRNCIISKFNLTEICIGLSETNNFCNMDYYEKHKYRIVDQNGMIIKKLKKKKIQTHTHLHFRFSESI